MGKFALLWMPIGFLCTMTMATNVEGFHCTNQSTFIKNVQNGTKSSENPPGLLCTESTSTKNPKIKHACLLWHKFASI